MSTAPTIEITNKTRGTVPRFAFLDIKNAVLGKKYELSLVFVTPKEARAVTLRTKQVDKASNVLAFTLSKTSGEIFLCPGTARLQAKDFGMDAQTFLAYLFIHGLLHIKGLPHSATMERQERQLMKRFGFSCNEQSSNRH